jgi:TP901 family phage tail tape measure protein
MPIEIDAKGLDRFEKLLGKLVVSLDSVDKGLRELKTSGSAIDRIFGGMSNFKEFAQELNGLGENGSKNLKLVTDGMRTLVRELNSLDDSKISGFFGGMSKFIDSVSGSDISNLEKMGKSFSNLGSGLRAIGKVNEGDLKAFAESFKSLGVTLKVTSTLVGLLPGSGQLEFLTKTLTTIASALRKFVNVAGDIKPSTVSNIVKTFGSLGVSLKIVSALIGVLPGQGPLTELSKTFDRLGRALHEFGSFTRNLNIKQIIKIFTGLGTIALALRTAVKLMGKDKTGIKVFGEAIQSLAQLFRSINKSGAPKDSLSGFKDSVKVIAQSLNELDRVKLNPRKLEAISKALASISAIKSTNLSGLSSLRGTLSKSLGGADIAKAVTEGILQRDFILFIGKATGDFLNSLGRLQAGIITAITTLGSTVRQFGQNLTSFGTNLFNNFGLEALTSSSFFNIASEFDDLSNKLQVFGNLTEDQLATATDFADEIGIKYPLSANEAVTAMINLSKAGLELNETMEALPAAADLAALSDTGSIENTSRLLIQVAGSFEQFTSEVEGGFDNINTAADLIARGANNSTASVESLQAGLANVGPIANAFGFTLEETVAILGLFEDAGIRGAEAGTQLKSLLTNITRDTPQTRQAFADLGVSVEGANGQFKDANTLLNDLITALNTPRTFTRSLNNITDAQQHELDLAQKALAAATRNTLIYQDGLSTAAVNAAEDEGRLQQRIQQNQQVQANAQDVIARITGSQAEAERISVEIARSEAENFRAIQQLAGSFGQAGLNILVNEGEDAIANFIDEMGRLPTAAEQAQLMLDSFNGDVEQLKGSFETLVKDIFLPMIHQFFRPLVQFGRTVADALNNLPQPIKEIISNAILLTSTLASVIGVFAIAAGIVIQFGGIVLTIVGTLAALSLNIIGVIAGIGAFIASFAGLVVIGGLVVGVITTIAAVIADFADIIRNNVGGAADKLATLRAGIDLFFNSLGKLVSEISGIGHDLFADLFTDDVANRGEALGNLFITINNAIGKFRQGIDQLSQVMITFRQFINLGRDLINIENALGSTDVTNTGALTEAGIAKAGVISRLTEQLNRIAEFDIVKKLFGEDINGEKLKTIFQTILSGLEELGTGIRQFLRGAFGLLTGEDDAVLQVRAGISKILKIAARIIEGFTGIDLSAAIIQFSSSNVEQGISAFVSSIFSAIKDVIVAHEGEITNLIVGLFTLVNPLGGVEALLKMLGLTDLAGAVAGVNKALTGLLRSTVATIFDVFQGKSLEEAVFGNFGRGGRTIIRTFRAVSRAIDNVIGVFSDLFAILFPPSDAFTRDIGTVIIDIISKISLLVNSFTNNVLIPFRQALPGIISTLNLFVTAFKFVFTPLVTFANVVLEQIKRVFNDIFSFLSGTTTLGQLGQTISDSLLAVLHGLPDAIGGVLMNLGSVIGSSFLFTLGQQIANEDAGGAIFTIANAIVGVINSALDSAANLLILGGIALDSDFMVNVGEAFKARDFGGVISIFATAIKDLVVSAINAVPQLIIDAGTTFDLRFLVELGNSLAKGETNEVVSAFANGIHEILKKAFDAIPGLIIAAGDVLNLENLRIEGLNLENSLAYQVFSGVVSSLAALPLRLVGAGIQAISDSVRAINENPVKVLPLFALSAALLGLVIGSAGLAGVATALSSLAGTLGLLGGPLALVARFMGRLALTLGGLTVSNILPILANGFRTLLGAISGFAFKFILLTEGLLLVQSIMENLGELLRGETDIIGFFNDVGLRLVQLNLELLGIDLPTDQIKTQVQQTLGFIQLMATNLGRIVRTGIQNVFDGIVFEASRLALRLSSALGPFSPAGAAAADAANSSLAVFDSIEASINEAMSARGETANGGQTSEFAQNMFNEIANQIANTPPGVLGLVQTQLRTQFASIFSRFSELDIEQLARENPVDFGNVMSVILNAGAFDEAIKKVVDENPNFLAEFIQLTAEQAPDAIKGIDTSALISELISQATDADESGATPEEVFKVIANLEAQAIITPEKADLLREDAQLQIDLVLGGINLQADAPVVLNPQPLPPSDPALAAITQANQELLQKAIDEGLIDDPTLSNPDWLSNTIQAGLDEAASRPPVAPDDLGQGVVDTAQESIDQAQTDNPLTLETPPIFTPTSPQEAEEFAGALLRIRDKSTEAAGALRDTATAATEYGVSIVANSLLASTAWALSSVLILFNANAMKLIIDQIGLSYKGFVDSVVLNVDPINTATLAIVDSIKFMYDQVQPQLQTLVDQVAALATGLGVLPGALSAVGIGLNGGGGQVPSQLATGGPVFKGNLYEVAEKGMSELLSINGRTFLIPGANGTVIPATNPRMMMGNPTPSVSRNSSVSSNVVIQEGPINISIVPPAGTNEAQIANLTSAKLAQERQANQSDVQRRLRNAGRI